MPGLTAVAERLRRRTRGLRFGSQVACVYAPLDYAWEPHRRYLERYGQEPREVLFVGMNPGPFGMAQTGVPFGDVELVRGWLDIEGPVGRPKHEHPRRPVLGFDVGRREVSGARFWGWARERFASPDAFFRRAFVWNYCPLCFMDEGGRNLTPDRLRPREARERLFTVCDEALAGAAAHLRPSVIVGIGRFAADRVRPVAERRGTRSGSAPHPSPASPRANQGWSAIFEPALRDLGIGWAGDAAAAPGAGKLR